MSITKTHLFIFLYLPICQITFAQTNELYSMLELKQIFVDRVETQKQLDWYKEKDAKFLYSLGMYSDSNFAIGIKPKGMKYFSWDNLDTSTEEWKQIKQEIADIIISHEKSFIEPFKNRRTRNVLDDISLNVKIKNKSTIDTLVKMEEIRYIEPLGSSMVMMEERFHEYLEYKTRKEVKYPEETFRPYQDEEGIVEDYQISEKRVLHKRKELKNCDPKSFERIGSFYWKDKAHVIWGGAILPEADPSSFALDKGVPRDKNHCYSRDKIIVGADPSSFGLQMDSMGYKLRDPFLYVRDDQFIYAERRKIKSADFHTFDLLRYKNEQGRRIGYLWARDKDRVYYRGYEIKGADPNTIKVSNEDQAIGKDYLIMRRKLVKIDSATFVSYPNGMIKSKFGVFDINGNQIEEIDLKTFTYLSRSYQKDATKIYCNGKHFDKVDFNTFQVTSHEDFSFDHKAIFYKEQEIKAVERTSWQLLTGGYSKDDKTVYYGERIIKGGHLATFEVIDFEGYPIGKDKNGNYFNGTLMEEERMRKIIKIKLGRK